MQAFHLERREDVSGVSGTGRVAEGVVFSNGVVALTWLSEHPTVSLYPSLATVEAIHGHDGRTLVVLDGSLPPAGEAGALAARPKGNRRRGRGLGGLAYISVSLGAGVQSRTRSSTIRGTR
jgi:hypothetical protein